MSRASHRLARALALLLLAASGGVATLLTLASCAATPEARARDSKAAFLEAYPVFMHPRCMNCHPAGDQPLQGDASQPHAQNVKRGPDGRGLFALKCASCHQEKNVPGLHMPPGNETWRLPSAEMPLVFEGKSPRELALQLADRARNGGKSLEELIHHVEQDALVLWAWQPGDGRMPPPLSHDDFVDAVRDWIEAGAAAPD
jgi:mono/diheme cytochrome c family protein